MATTESKTEKQLVPQVTLAERSALWREEAEGILQEISEAGPISSLQNTGRVAALATLWSDERSVFYQVQRVRTKTRLAPTIKSSSQLKVLNAKDAKLASAIETEEPELLKKIATMQKTLSDMKAEHALVKRQLAEHKKNLPEYLASLPPLGDGAETYTTAVSRIKRELGADLDGKRSLLVYLKQVPKCAQGERAKLVRGIKGYAGDYLKVPNTIKVPSKINTGHYVEGVEIGAWNEFVKIVQSVIDSLIPDIETQEQVLEVTLSKLENDYLIRYEKSRTP